LASKKKVRAESEPGAGAAFAVEQNQVAEIRSNRGLVLVDGENVLDQPSEQVAHRFGQAWGETDVTFWRDVREALARATQQMEENKRSNRYHFEEVDQGMLVPTHPVITIESPRVDAAGIGPRGSVHWEMHHCRNPECCKPLKTQSRTDPYLPRG
jgi:hypothetical protein